jgi:hypothetical protein
VEIPAAPRGHNAHRHYTQNPVGSCPGGS